MSKEDILYSPFDVNTHKNNFINYLEIIITKEGEIKYAVPGHSECLELLYAKQNNIIKRNNEDCFDYFDRAVKFTRDACPKEYYCDYNTWLCAITGAIMVWGNPTNKIIGEPNDKQIKALKMLESEELYYDTRINK